MFAERAASAAHTYPAGRGATDSSTTPHGGHISHVTVR